MNFSLRFQMPRLVDEKSRLTDSQSKEKTLVSLIRCMASACHGGHCHPVSLRANKEAAKRLVDKLACLRIIHLNYFWRIIIYIYVYIYVSYISQPTQNPLQTRRNFHQHHDITIANWSSMKQPSPTIMSHKCIPCRLSIRCIFSHIWHRWHQVAVRSREDKPEEPPCNQKIFTGQGHGNSFTQ